MSLRDDQIEAVREVLGWEMEPMGEYKDVALRTLGDVVDAVMAEEALWPQGNHPPDQQNEVPSCRCVTLS